MKIKSALPRVCIVSPADASANNGNWFTAARWQRFLKSVAQVRIGRDWQDEPTDVLIALHARRSADAIARFASDRPQAPLALVLTGTDLYRDIDHDARARHSLECASQLVVLQEEGLHRLTAGQCEKARVIEQSAPAWKPRRASQRYIDLVAVGHLRDEKDPLTLMAAARLLHGDPALHAVRITHIGDALDPALGDAARAVAAEYPGYRWLGGLPHALARRRIAGARAVVHMSRMEGGANVVIEAVCSGVPVLASRIPGNVGLLGQDYDGYFPVGEGAALATLVRRFCTDEPFAARLRAQCAIRAPRFGPAVEQRNVRRLLADLCAAAPAIA